MAAGKISMRRKMAVILACMLVAFLAVVVKLANIQLVQGSDLQQRAEEDRTRDMSLSASRGTIYDRNGSKLAISVSVDSISAAPPDVRAADRATENRQPAEDTAIFLSNILDMDQDTVLERITADAQFSWVKRRVDYDVAEAIRQAKLPGININPETRRSYPKGVLAAHVLGYAGIDNQGLEGLELMLDEELSGTAGRIIGEYDARGRELPQARHQYVPSTNGYDVYLTLDENIQYFAERELDKLMASEAAPQSAGIIMMRPKTGEILAWAIRPTYDPNNYNDAPEGSQRNILNADIYEPGSTFKIITAAAALEEGTATLESRYYDHGHIMVAGTKINCWRSYNPHGSQSFTEALANSCNPALIEISQSLEAKEPGLFYKYIRAFGFGDTTGIQLSGEAYGLLYNSPGPVERATSAIGQGISVTAIQMVAAVSAVANGGVLVQPQVVYEIRDGENVIQGYETQIVNQVISAETSETLRYVLEQVVTTGTGKNAYVEGYRVGGKTGTAQKPEGGVYADGKYIASFIGMAPVNDPEIVCLVLVDEPVQGHHQGSQVAAPVFAAVVEDTMRYLGITPQITASAGPNDLQTANTTVPDLAGLGSDSAASLLRLADLQVEVRGTGSRVTEQVPAAFASVQTGSTVIITLGEGGSSWVTVPDLTGKRLSNAAEWLAALGLSMVSEGSEGIALEQDPVPGTRVEPGSAVTVRFGTPEANNTGIAP